MNFLWQTPRYVECIRLLGEAYVKWSGDTAGHYSLAVDAFVMAVVLQLRQWHIRKGR